MNNKKLKFDEIWNSKNAFTITKIIFLISLTILVIINSITLVYTIPIIGSHIIPDNQAAAELWTMVAQIIEICISAIIVCGIVYGVAVVINRIEKEVKHE